MKRNCFIVVVDDGSGPEYQGSMMFRICHIYIKKAQDTE